MPSPSRSRRHILNVIRFPIGGIRSYLRYTYRWLDPGRYEATLLTVARPESRLLPGEMAPMPVALVEVGESRAALSLLARERALLRGTRFDLVHSQGFTAGVLTVLADPLRTVPHVLTLHETLRDEQFRGPLGAVKRRLLGLVLARIDRVITVSDDARENLLAHIPLSQGARRKIRTIRNGVDVEGLNRAAAEPHQAVRPRFGIDAQTRCLGFFGRFMPEKGFDVLLEAVRQLAARRADPAPFKIIAFNDGAYVREYREKVERLGIGDRFVFAGFQPQVAATLPEFDASIMPSLREALPLAAMEALVMGCPLIASDSVGLREVTRDTPAIVARAGDPASLAEAIGGLIENPSAHKSRALAFAPVARDRFDSRLTAAALEEVFDEVLAGR